MISPLTPSSGRSLTCGRSPADRRHRGFTLTELLVVIAIIVLLLGVLLPALAAVRNSALRTRTTSTMNGFASAAATFQQDHDRLPGIVPESVLAQSDAPISGTENAILDMMGGAFLEAEDPEYYANLGGDWQEFHNFGGNIGGLKINLAMIGNGPRIDGRTHNPYLSLSQDELQYVEGQAGEDSDFPLPDLLDAYGQPIMYLRSQRRNGPLVGPAQVGSPGQQRPQFSPEPLYPYLQSEGLGELGKDQIGGGEASILNGGDTYELLAQILRNPGLGDADDPINTGQPRGPFALFSAGRDGIYFSRIDGPGTSDEPDDGQTLLENPQVVEEYDDLVQFGGG